jgi:hypothetical protein
MVFRDFRSYTQELARIKENPKEDTSIMGV